MFLVYRPHLRFFSLPTGRLAGTVPFYEPSVQGPPPQMIATSLPPRPVVVHTAPPQLLSSALPQVYQTVAPQPMLAPIPLQQQYPYGYGGYGGYGGYATQKPDGPLKRFFKGAADGFMLGSMGWLG
ncbi:hypothetical protein NECAME_15641 [Necator americanus]|uniref:Uncharacterized protein n=1 Tax=Necator americanus TaxID=51031 RepID=W2SGS2_NECAM|nr:hypothetical protein NECAME_15641 [Necator americanus]ETN68775.1 hypothetical protein NECAME_15641 [Necator americanus]